MVTRKMSCGRKQMAAIEEEVRMEAGTLRRRRWQRSGDGGGVIEEGGAVDVQWVGRLWRLGTRVRRSRCLKEVSNCYGRSWSRKGPACGVVEGWSATVDEKSSVYHFSSLVHRALFPSFSLHVAPQLQRPRVIFARSSAKCCPVYETYLETPDTPLRSSGYCLLLVPLPPSLPAISTPATASSPARSHRLLLLLLLRRRRSAPPPSGFCPLFFHLKCLS